MCESHIVASHHQRTNKLPDARTITTHTRQITTSPQELSVPKRCSKDHRNDSEVQAIHNTLIFTRQRLSKGRIQTRSPISNLQSTRVNPTDRPSSSILFGRKTKIMLSARKLPVRDTSPVGFFVIALDRFKIV